MPNNIIFLLSRPAALGHLRLLCQPLDITPNLDAGPGGREVGQRLLPQPVAALPGPVQTGKFPRRTGCFRNNIMLPPSSKTLGQLH